MCGPCSHACPMDVELVCHCACHASDWMSAYTRTRADRVAWASLARRLRTSPAQLSTWAPGRVIAACKRLGLTGM